MISNVIVQSIGQSVAELPIRAAESWPENGIHYVSEGGTTVWRTYPELLLEARHLAGGLRATGLRPGDRVALLLEQPRDFIPAFWACVLGGYVACPLMPLNADTQRREAQLHHVDELLGGPLFVTTEALRNERLQVPGLRVALTEELVRYPPELTTHAARGEDTVLLVLTSGSTGNSKAVRLTHDNLLASMAAKTRRQELTARDVTFNWVAFDHVAALLECHMLPLYVGASQVHSMPRMVLDEPVHFLELVAEHGVTMTFAPNFLLGQLNKALASRSLPSLDLSRLQKIICGGEAVVCTTARAFLDNLRPLGLSRGVLWPAFGMTETCAGSVYSREFPDGDGNAEFASLGLPVDGLEMRVVDDEERPLPEGEVGELELRGPMIFGGYFNNEAATRQAFTKDGWFRTGDRGALEKGCLSLAGRSKDSIIVNGVNYYGHELEAALEQLDGIERSYTAVFPTRKQGSETEQLVVVFSPSFPVEDEPRLHSLIVAIRNTVLLLWGFRPALILPLPRSEIPKTSLGKILRLLLRKRLESTALAVYEQAVAAMTLRQLGGYTAPEGETETRLAAIFAEVFQADPDGLSATTSFFDLGGTSLDILRLKRRLAEHFGDRELSIATLMVAPSVRELGAELTRTVTHGDAAYDPVVTLQSTGDKTPLFCVHPGIGEVLVFVNLAKYFVNERPVHALRARGFNEGETHFGSFEEMVQCYVRGIRVRQPKGPYAILGYSFGGVVAFEIAKALERDGERVDLLGLINVPPHIKASRQQIDFTYTAVNLAFLLSLITREQAEVLPDRFRDQRSQPEQLARLLELAPRARLEELDLDLKKFTVWAEVAFGLVKLGRTYEPSESVRAATVFYAAPPVRYRHMTRLDWRRGHLEAWNPFSRAPVAYVEVPGQHQTLMGKYAASFQELLRSALNAAERDRTG